jgi:GMP synthase (glutamine-hydrolysing)
VGEVTPERLRILREADTIVVSEMKASDWYYRVWQSFAVLLSGALGRRDGRPADLRKHDRASHRRESGWYDRRLGRLPYEILARISSRIVNEVKGVNRVATTSRPSRRARSSGSEKERGAPSANAE